MWMAQDDTNPRRRTAFGSEEAARRFAEAIPGWSVFSNQDDRWRPVTGRTEAEPPGDA